MISRDSRYNTMNTVDPPLSEPHLSELSFKRNNYVHYHAHMMLIRFVFNSHKISTLEALGHLRDKGKIFSIVRFVYDTLVDNYMYM